MVVSDIIKFRKTGNESAIIEDSKSLLGLPNDSVTIRVLLRLGKDRLDNLFKQMLNVSQDLKFSEIDYLTTSLNVYLKQFKRDQMTEKNENTGEL